MVAYTVNAASVGTALVAAAGTITSITIAAAPTMGSGHGKVLVVDAANAAAAGGLGQGSPKTLFGGSLIDLAYLFEPRPNVGLTPGLTPPAYPKGVDNLSTPFSNGIFVLACPAGVTLTVNA